MKKVLIVLWQLPQNIIGGLLTLWHRAEMQFKCNDSTYINVYYKDHFFRSGISLGDYIILDSCYLLYQDMLEDSINHEHGHQKQSLYLGPLYLLIIGLPSLLGNIAFRIFKIKPDKYYKQPWEHWADKLGGVKR